MTMIVVEGFESFWLIILTAQMIGDERGKVQDVKAVEVVMLVN